MPAPALLAELPVMTEFLSWSLVSTPLRSIRIAPPLFDRPPVSVMPSSVKSPP